MKDLDRLKKLLETPQRPFITTHIRPDGDALGCILALHQFFKMKGHQSVAVVPSDYPYYYNWFPGVEQLLNYHKDRKQIIKTLEESTVIFVVDFNSLHRNGELGKILADSTLPRVIIDHHTEPEKIYDYWFSDVKACATGEILYEIFEQLDSSVLQNKDIATCLYAAINTDCGSFKFSSVTGKTHRIAAALIDTGIDIGKINAALYDNFTVDRLKFWGYCLIHKLTILKELKTAYITVTRKEMEENKLKTSDLEMLANYPLIVEDIVLSALIVEREKYVKVSFRSKYNFPTNQLARKYFNGGGHLNASGGEINLPIEETVKLFLDKILEYKEFLQ
jgi:bifunctional oligoribonuclease and PAP phosphatase NrnA